MSQYYADQQWGGAGGQQNNNWEHQTPPARSGASSAVPREETAAFTYQLEEVDRAIDNLQKSGKIPPFGMPPGGGGGARRWATTQTGLSSTDASALDPRMGPGVGSRPHSAADFERGHTPSANLQNFYASQRHQPSRGSNEAEQMMQAKRRQAAQRERELRNYHQEQQYNRNVQAEHTGTGTSPGFGPKPDRADRTLSPGSMSEDERRELIARQRSALYGEGPYVDETGTPRPGLTGPPHGPAGFRGHSPLAYEFSRPPAGQPEGALQQQDGAQPGTTDLPRANSTSSPQINVPPQQQQQQQQPISRTSVSSPGGSPAGQGPAVAPIGTRPSGSGISSAKRASPTLPSPLNDGGSNGGPVGQSNAASGWNGRSNSMWANNNSGLPGAQPGVWA